MSKELFEKGLQIRKEVMGEAYTQNTLDSTDDFDRGFQEWMTENAFGRIWGDEALSRKQRSLNNLCILAALNRPRQFEGHFRAAIRNGCTKEELRATLHQIAGYVGFPAGVEAFRIARKVFSEQEG
jgi:4-carboxymuconolactone decarboxylase